MNIKLAWGVAAVALMIPFSNSSISQSITDGIDTIESEEGSFRLEIVAETGDIPWGMDFLPDGRLLVSGRTKETIYIVNTVTGSVTELEGFSGPHFDTDQLGGMMDILLHPDYAENGWIYYSFSGDAGDGYATIVERARIEGNRFVDVERLYQTIPGTEDAYHSSRLALKDGYLFVGESEHELDRSSSMDMTTTMGKVVRIHEDGRIPEDNPFSAKDGNRLAIWTLGHRNPHGLKFNPFTGELWSHEQGPKGGDEINIIRAGRNYGWPVISYGEEYEGGPVGEGLYRKDGMEQPVFFWKPSIAPSSMLFYTGDAYPNWHGNLFVGAMAGTHLNRLTILEDRVLNEERLLDDRGWRVRVVRQGPDDLIYIGIDQGYILRLVPVEEVIAEKQDDE